MAITAYTGPPGSGKSYALVEQVIVPAVMAGRRVLTNVAGVDPDKVRAYCQGKMDEPSRCGSVVLFDGRQATEPHFFPTEEIPDSETFVKGGDLIVFDEWRLYWPKRGKLPSADLEPFLRWHRHLVSADGVACDVAIASQLPTDIHMDFRGLVESSYKFRKLKSVGLNKAYAWDGYDGHLQPKGKAERKGNGTYRDEITALYSSYSTTKQATELVTDKRMSIFGKSTVVMMVGGVVVAISAGWYIYGFFTGGAGVIQAKPVAAGPGTPGQQIAAAQAPANSSYRIVGQVVGDQGVRVIVLDKAGALRVLRPDGFTFDADRPVSGTVDGQRVVAEDRVSVDAPTMMQLPGMVP